MQFDPIIHTKEYLLKNRKVVEKLSKKSAVFASSMVAEDFDILKMVASHRSYKTVAHLLAQFQKVWLNSKGVKNLEVLNLKDRYQDSVAHYLARYQSIWVSSEEAKNLDVLGILNNYQWSVAHTLARYQPKWLQSDAAKNANVLSLACFSGHTVAHELSIFRPKWLKSVESEDPLILRLADHDGRTVAHTLAKHQPNWINSASASDLNMLCIVDKKQWSVAHQLVIYNSKVLNHQPIYQKRILSLVHNNKLLAEYIVEKHVGLNNLDEIFIAMKLISQFCAYKSSKSISSKVGALIFEKTKKLINDCLDHSDALRYSIALYSTCFHNMNNEKFKMDINREEWREIMNFAEDDITRLLESEEINRIEWNDMLCDSENMIRQILEDKPDLFLSEYKQDNLCEPGVTFFHRLKAEFFFKKIDFNHCEENDFLENPKGPDFQY